MGSKDEVGPGAGALKSARGVSVAPIHRFKGASHSRQGPTTLNKMFAVVKMRLQKNVRNQRKVARLRARDRTGERTKGRCAEAKVAVAASAFLEIGFLVGAASFGAGRSGACLSTAGLGHGGIKGTRRGQSTLCESIQEFSVDGQDRESRIHEKASLTVKMGKLQVVALPRAPCAAQMGRGPRAAETGPSSCSFLADPHPPERSRLKRLPTAQYPSANLTHLQPRVLALFASSAGQLLHKSFESAGPPPVPSSSSPRATRTALARVAPSKESWPVATTHRPTTVAAALGGTEVNPDIRCVRVPGSYKQTKVKCPVQCQRLTADSSKAGE